MARKKKALFYIAISLAAHLLIICLVLNYSPIFKDTGKNKYTNSSSNISSVLRGKVLGDVLHQVYISSLAEKRNLNTPVEISNSPSFQPLLTGLKPINIEKLSEPKIIPSQDRVSEISALEIEHKNVKNILTDIDNFAIGDENISKKEFVFGALTFDQEIVKEESNPKTFCVNKEPIELNIQVSSQNPKIETPTCLSYPYAEAKTLEFAPKKDDTIVLPNSQIMAAKMPERGRNLEYSLLPSIRSYGIDSSYNVQDWSDYFDVAVKISHRKDQEGYLFLLELTPKVDLSPRKIKQNIYFLIDRSNSVEKHRFTMFKKAVLKSLPYLREGDSFNIIVFDNKISRLCSSNLPVSSSSFHLAESFLNEQEAGGLFAATDIYTTLPKVVPQNFSEREVNIAFLISDGGTLLGVSEQQTALNNWIKTFGGKLYFYSAAAGKKNNLLLLDLVSSCMGGKLIYSETLAGLPRKVSKFVHDMSIPVGKNLSLSLTRQDYSKNIVIDLAPSQPDILANDKPITLFGFCDSLQEFSLLLQGVDKNQCFNIKKRISFKDAEIADNLLQKELIQEKLVTLYKDFLRDGQKSCLDMAKGLLKNTNKELALD